MSKVPAYITAKMTRNNLFATCTGFKPLELPNKDNALQWARHIYNDLSPENLHCDGEISASQARAKYKQIMAALNYVNKAAGRQITEDEVYDC